MKRGCTIGFSRFSFLSKVFSFGTLSFEGALAVNVIAYITYSFIIRKDFIRNPLNKVIMLWRF